MATETFKRVTCDFCGKQGSSEDDTIKTFRRVIYRPSDDMKSDHWVEVCPHCKNVLYRSIGILHHATRMEVIT